MLRTDYDRIADRYDEDRKGRAYAPHHLIKERLGRGERNLAVLDVGCGPGRWLAAQCAHFRGYDVTWAGVEPFSRMLGLAWRNAPGADILPGRAEALPYADRSFDLVMSVTSFHHFDDKEKSLDEIVRVLRPGGLFELGNIDPWSMEKWSPYFWFPETRAQDERWFWPADRIVTALRDRGLEVKHAISPSKTPTRVEEILRGALRRTVSQLTTIDEATYERGLARLRAALTANPDAMYDDEVGWLMVTATKPAG